MHPQVSKARAHLAGITRSVRYGERPTADLANARRDLASAKIGAYIEKTLAEAPPLTDEQRTRLVELLRPVHKAGAV